MQDSKKIENKVMYVLAVLLCLTLASTWLMSHMYARYATGTTGNDSARVAVFGHSESINVENFPEDWKPGTSYPFKITVSNQKRNEISEVAQQYNIEVVTQGNLPFVYTLKDSAGNTIDEFTESSSKTSAIFSNDKMKFEAAKSGEDTYTLLIQWPEDQNDSTLAGIPDAVKININVKQID